MDGRPQTLWSVDQANFEWNGPKTESLVNDFLHKWAKMCNSDFLDCKLKSQKFNYRFDSISWFCATLWYQKKKRGQVNILTYTAPCCFSGHGPIPVSLHLCNFEIQLQNYINHVVVHIFRDVFLCPVPLIPVLLSFLPLSPLGTFLFGRRRSSRRTGNIPSSWYKRWRWTQFATAIIVSRQTVPVPLILGQIG